VRGVLSFRRARDEFGDTVHSRLQHIAHQIRHRWIARCFGIKIDDERGDHSRLVLTAMRGEQNFERLKQRLRLARAFQHVADFCLVAIGHRRNDRLLVFEIAIDQPDADAGFGTNVVHAGLVKSAFGKADQSGIEDLGATIGIGRFYLGLRHRLGR
jgi:hypothetical protein